MYFSADQVSASFKRLASRKRADGKKTKTHLERTSVLMCFLAFDAVCKEANLTCLDLNPDKAEGKEKRKAIELEFTKLVLLDRTLRKISQVSELGKIDGAGKDPEKRLSSNFLTVPLKKATEQSGPFFYPKRPATPMIKLGQAATGLKWGMEYHPDWPINLPELLSEVKDSTPFTDLAVFVMRDTPLTGKDYIEALSNAIEKRFSSQLAKFWVEKIRKEKLFAKHIFENPFSPTHQAFAKPMQAISANRFDSLTRSELIEHISHLEGILEANQIEFESLTERNKP